MTKDEIYADIMTNLAIAAKYVTRHTMSCDLCQKWEVSGHRDLYTLKCSDGWILRTEAEKIETKADILLGIV